MTSTESGESQDLKSGESQDLIGTIEYLSIENRHSIGRPVIPTITSEVSYIAHISVGGGQTSIYASATQLQEASLKPMTSMSPLFPFKGQEVRLRSRPGTPHFDLVPRSDRTWKKPSLQKALPLEEGVKAVVPGWETTSTARVFGKVSGESELILGHDSINLIRSAVSLGTDSYLYESSTGSVKVAIKTLEDHSEMLISAPSGVFLEDSYGHIHKDVFNYPRILRVFGAIPSIFSKMQPDFLKEVPGHGWVSLTSEGEVFLKSKTYCTHNPDPAWNLTDWTSGSIRDGVLFWEGKYYSDSPEIQYNPPKGLTRETANKLVKAFQSGEESVQVSKGWEAFLSEGSSCKVGPYSVGFYPNTPEAKSWRALCNSQGSYQAFSDYPVPYATLQEGQTSAQPYVLLPNGELIQRPHDAEEVTLREYNSLYGFSEERSDFRIDSDIYRLPSGLFGQVFLSKGFGKVVIQIEGPPSVKVCLDIGDSSFPTVLYSKISALPPEDILALMSIWARWAFPELFNRHILEVLARKLPEDLYSKLEGVPVRSVVLNCQGRFDLIEDLHRIPGAVKGSVALSSDRPLKEIEGPQGVLTLVPDSRVPAQGDSVFQVFVAEGIRVYLIRKYDEEEGIYSYSGISEVRKSIFATEGYLYYWDYRDYFEGSSYSKVHLDYLRGIPKHLVEMCPKISGDLYRVPTTTLMRVLELYEEGFSGAFSSSVRDPSWELIEEDSLGVQILNSTEGETIIGCKGTYYSASHIPRSRPSKSKLPPLLSLFAALVLSSESQKVLQGTSVRSKASRKISTTSES